MSLIGVDECDIIVFASFFIFLLHIRNVLSVCINMHSFINFYNSYIITCSATFCLHIQIKVLTHCF